VTRRLAGSGDVQLDSLDNYEGKTVHSRVYALLKGAIVEGKLASNAHIRQSEIASMLGISISPVREALHALAADGIIVFDPHRGATVRAYTLADFEEMMEIKVSLEPGRSRRLLENIRPEEIDEIRTVHEAIVRDPDRYMELNPTFHDLLEDASRAPQMTRILRTLTDISNVMLNRTLHDYPHRVLEGISEHARIIDALVEHDLEALIATMIKHNQATFELARATLLAEQIESAVSAEAEAAEPTLGVSAS
jgi:DNA-binding GntR family transcriptional regulator